MEVEVEEAISVREPGTRMFNGKPLNNKKVMNPLKILVYGDNGVGKSCFAAKAKNPIFLDLEGNIEHLPEVDTPAGGVFHKERIKSFADFEKTLQLLLNQDHEFKTIVIDSLDTLYSLCMKKIKLPSGERPYGGDHRLCAQEFAGLCWTLDTLREKKKMSVVLLAHAKIKTVDSPLVNVYERWETTLNESIFRILMDWVSGVFFAVKEVAFKKDEHDKERIMVHNKANRWLYTSGNAAYFAKNTYSLPERIPMDWDSMTKTILKNFESKGEV